MVLLNKLAPVSSSDALPEIINLDIPVLLPSEPPFAKVQSASNFINLFVQSPPIYSPNSN